jgi:hypothetical protein
VPPLIATTCAAAPGDVKLTDVGASVTTAGPPLTVMLTVAVRLGFDASAMVSTQAPAPAGAIATVCAFTAASATPPQPVTLYGAAPPLTATLCTADLGVANVTLDALKPSGGAVPIRIFAIIPPSSCERM